MKKLSPKSRELVLDSLLDFLVFLEKRFVFLLLLLVSFYYTQKSFPKEILIPRNSPATLGLLTKIPYKVKDSEFPRVTAKSVLIADLNTTRILYQKNPDILLAPASTTKLMTALVSLDIYPSNVLIPAPEECSKIEGNRLALSREENISVEDLLHAILIASSNDAACVLANYAVTEEDFVDLMNKKAIQLGMKNTLFTNPIGFDSYDFSHKSTASDLYLLAKEARKNPIISSIYKKPFYVLKTGNHPRSIYSTNHLLTQRSGSVGMKTGTTTQAGEVFIYEFADKDKNLLIILMGSEDRFLETESILEWLETNYKWL